MPQNRVSDTSTHLLLNTINGVLLRFFSSWEELHVQDAFIFFFGMPTCNFLVDFEKWVPTNVRLSCVILKNNRHKKPKHEELYNFITM